MKHGLQPGQTAEIEFTVTPQMFARFDGVTVHELLSTSELAHQMEWAARKTILNYLEPHEEGMGAHVDLHHLMMTRAGTKVKVKATIADIRDNKVECDVEATSHRGKVAKGTILQVIVDKTWLTKKIQEMEVVEGIIREEQAIKDR